MRVKDYLYYYKAFVNEVYDGDTITVDIDLGLRMTVKNEKVRLARINAPEVRGVQREDGLKSRDYLREIILEKTVFIKTEKDSKGKYGRYIAEIFIEDVNGNLVNVNEKLVDQGFAAFKEY